MRIKIGGTNILEDIPRKIEIKNKPYIINKNEKNEYVIFDAVCPHFNGVVSEISNKTWRCPNHGWTFDSKTGDSLNSTKHLHSYPIQILENELFVELPIRFPNILEDSSKGLEQQPKISLINNACLLFEWKNFRLITDPWIEGPIFLGSFINYPPNQISISELPKIDAIWISHEHSDHLNEYSLSLFDKNIAIYAPNYDNKRLEGILKRLGFKNIYSLSNGETKELSDEIKITSYFSGSVWNDSIQFIQFGNFKVLNLNDAGFNWKIKEEHANVDIVCTQFTGPGSSYPLTWTNLNAKQKSGIIKKTNEGFLEWLKQIVEITKARYLLPFANFNEIYHPKLIHYLSNKPQNTINDVKKIFEGKDVEVLDLLPGESWDGKFSRISDREKFFDDDFRLDYLKKKFEQDDKSNNEEYKYEILDDEIKTYFEDFSNSFLATEVGKYSIKLILKDISIKKEFLILFEKGKVSVKKIEAEMDSVNMHWECPGHIIQKVIKNDLSWDEAQLGYWCKFSRDPDIYNVALWKILHSPWRARKYISNELLMPISRISIADLIEHNGDKISNILQKYGLFCVGCGSSIGENIHDACEIHGFSEQQKSSMIKEIEAELNIQIN